MLLPWLCLLLLPGAQYGLWQWAQRRLRHRAGSVAWDSLLPALPLLWPPLLAWLVSLAAAWAGCNGTVKQLSCHIPSVQTWLDMSYLALALAWFIAIPLGLHLLMLVRARHAPD